MSQESISNFLARGGVIERVHYKAIEDVPPLQAWGKEGMRRVINAGRRGTYFARQAGIKSGEARRAKAARARAAS